MSTPQLVQEKAVLELGFYAAGSLERRSVPKTSTEATFKQFLLSYKRTQSFLCENGSSTSFSVAYVSSFYSCVTYELITSSEEGFRLLFTVS